MRSRLVVLAMVFILAAVTVTWAGGKQEGATGTAGGKVSITWMLWWIPEWGQTKVDWIISNFAQSHPNITVTTIGSPYDPYRDKLVTLMQSGNTPDVFGTESQWIPALSKLGTVQDLGPLLGSDSAFKSSIPASAIIKYAGVVRMIYYYEMGYHFAYNVDLASKIGAPLPTSWQDLPDWLAAVKKSGLAQQGLALQFNPKDADHVMGRLMFTPLRQFGGKLVNDDGSAAFNSDIGVKVLEYWKSLIDAGLVFPDPVATTENTMYDMMSSGTLPMQLNGPWVASLVHQSNANVKIVYLPPLKEEVANGTYLSGSGLGLSSKSKQAAAATEFFKYLWSEPVASQMIAGTHLPFTNVKALSSPANASDPILGPEVQMLSNPNSVSINPFPNMEQAQEALANEMANYILGKKSAKQALDDAAATWDKLRMQQ